DGVWARGCARLMARQIDRATGRDAALVALIIGATPSRVGFVTPSSPLPLDQAFTAARGHGATLFARVHIHSTEEFHNILLDVLDAAKLETKFSRDYPRNRHGDLPPLRAATIDLSHAPGLAVSSDALLDGAPFVETS